MKKILFALICAFAVLATGCQKEDKGNDLVGTTWVALESVEGFPIAMTTLVFETESSASMTREPITGDSETMTVSYTYNPPYIILSSPYYSLSGVIEGNVMTFEDADVNGDLVFRKGE